MCVDLILDWRSMPAIRSRQDYFGAVGPDASCQLSWQGFWTRFSQGRAIESIAKDAGIPASRVLQAYDRYFRQLFKDKEYEEYRRLLAAHYLLEKMPDYPPLKFFARKAWEQGLVVRPVSSSDHPNRMRLKYVMVEERLCCIHSFGNHRHCELIVATLERKSIELVGVVQGDPDPERGMILPREAVLRMRRIRNGTHVRINPRRRYADAIVLAA